MRRLVLTALAATALCACGSSDPCKRACSRYRQCFGLEGDAAPSSGPEANCPIAACDSREQECVAGCVAKAPCEALKGTDAAAVQELAGCKAECAKVAAPDLGAGGDGTPPPPPADDGGSCKPPFVRCGAACVNTGTDPAHCGGCGRACAGGELCVTGSCEKQSGDCTTGGCPTGYYCDLVGKKCLPGCAVDAQCGPGAKCNLGKHSCCAPGESVCSGACVDTATSTASCGACGNSCPGIANGHAVCNGGSCGLACDGGRELCGGPGGSQCVLTASDPKHCGGCGTSCDTPWGGSVSCVAGKCAPGCSGAGQTVCNGKCVDTQSDLANCGGCSNACPTGGGTASCSAGKCSIACATGKTLCAGQCVDLQTDAKNCGYCGKVCPTGGANTAPKCSAGKCGLSCYSPTFSCVDTCCDPTLSGGAHCCTGKDSYGKTFGYCLKYGYSCS
jgi:hypothetical protein